MESASRERLRKIEALRQGGGTDGEREAAAAALERVKRNLPFQITCTIINIDKQETLYEVKFRDIEGQSQIRLIPRELFQHPAKVAEHLLKVGASLTEDRTEAVKIVNAAIELKSDKTQRVTARTGWYECDSFVYPGETFGKLNERIVHKKSDELDPAFGLSAGSLEGWRGGLREPCQFSDYLIIEIGQKASNTLLELIGEDEGCILHLHGRESDGAEKTASSSGKTLATMVAASMTGRCKRNDLITFGITETALCDLAFARNHVGVELDEEGRSLGGGRGPQVKADQLSYLLTSGRGSVRSNYATRHTDLKNRVWLANGISSGELPLDANSNRSARSEGAQVRMIGLPVPPGAKGGIFNRVRERGKERAERCKQLAAQAEATIAANHGVAFPALLRAIVSMRASLRDQMNRRIAELISKVEADDVPWERRFARKLAIAGATAVLLAELGIAPWSKIRAIRAFRRLYRKAREAVATVDEIAEYVISEVRKSLSSGIFPMLSKGRPLSARTVRRAQNGFLKELPGIGSALIIPLTHVDKLVRRPRLASAVLQRLAVRGFVHVGGDEKVTRQVLVKGLTQGRHRYVCFDLAALRDGRK